MAFSVRTEAGLAALNSQLATRSYLAGAAASAEDFARFSELRAAPTAEHPHARRWYEHIKFVQQQYPNRAFAGVKPAAGGKADRHADAAAKAAAGGKPAGGDGKGP